MEQPELVVKKILTVLGASSEVFLTRLEGNFSAEDQRNSARDLYPSSVHLQLQQGCLLVLIEWAEQILHALREAKPGVSKPGGFPLFKGKVLIVSCSLSGLFLVGVLNRREKEEKDGSRKSQKIGKITKKSGKSKKRTKKDKSGRASPNRESNLV